MASLIIIGALLLLARRGRAGVIDRTERPNGICESLIIPVNASSPGAIYSIQPVNNDIDAQAYAINADTWSGPKGPQGVIENITISGVFNIAAQLCVPTSTNVTSQKLDMLQIATHGLHYDSRYWDPEIKHGANSYVNAALKAGYPILTYDRLGVGKSDKPDAYNVVQAPIQLEILHQLTLMARDGRLYDLTQSSRQFRGAMNDLMPPSKIIHVGHSFGSVLTSAYISQYGSFSDGAVITGYIPNEMLGKVGAIAFSLEYAATSSSEYPGRSSGYVVSTKQGIQAIFFGGDVNTAFTPEMLDYGDKIKQPITVGEYTSAYTVALAGSGSTEFEGPIQYMLPEFDFYICAGDCKGLYDVEALKKLFPNTPELEVYIQPNTGHALPLHNNATAGYQVMFDFLEKNEL